MSAPVSLPHPPSTSHVGSDVRLSVLERIRVASPCTANWEDMTAVRPGDDRVRRCDECNLNVHNLSAMERDEAEALVSMHFVPGGAKYGERFCGQWRKRRDGTIIFGDCPSGAARLRERAVRSAARAAALGAAMVGLVGLSSLLAACAESRTMGSVRDPRDANGDDHVMVTPGSIAFEPAPEPVENPKPAGVSTPSESDAGPEPF